MLKTASSPTTRAPDDILDAYLAERFGVGLETALLDGIEGHVTPALAGVVRIQAQEVGHHRYGDGGLDETFEGRLEIEGIVYLFRVTAYSVPDAYVHRMLTNLESFKPEEWSAAARLG